MQQIQQFDPTAATSGTFNLPLPNGGWLVLMNESVVGLLLEFGDGSTALVNPFTIRAMRVGARQSQCLWKQQYLITGGQAPTGLNLVTGEAYDPATWTGGEFILALPRMVNVGNQTGGGTMNDLVNDGNALGTQIIESTASGSPSSNILVTNDGNIQVKVLSNGVYVTVLSITPGTADTAATVTLVGSATNASHWTDNLGNGVTLAEVGSSPSYREIVTLPETAGIAQGFGVRVWDGSSSHVVTLANADGSSPFPQVSYFSGTGDGTFSHGLGKTPLWVGITSAEPNSTMTVGVDSIGATTVHVNAGQNWPWIGVAIG